jgi:hypothetical protein
VVQNAHTDVLQGLHDLVGRVDVLFGRIALLSGVTCERPIGVVPDNLAAALSPPSFCLDSRTGYSLDKFERVWSRRRIM